MLNDVYEKLNVVAMSAFEGSNVTMPYAEIGGSFQQYLFWSIVVVGGRGLILLLLFEIGCTQNIVSR